MPGVPVVRQWDTFVRVSVEAFVRGAIPFLLSVGGLGSRPAGTAAGVCGGMGRA